MSNEDKLRRILLLRDKGCGLLTARKIVERNMLREQIAKADSFHDIRMILLGAFPKIGEE